MKGSYFLVAPLSAKIPAFFSLMYVRTCTSTCVHVYAEGAEIGSVYRKYLHNRSMSMEIHIMRMSEYSYVLRHKAFNVFLTLGE